MRASIIIPVFNSINTIKECMDSILFQILKEGFEIIVVDNGSTDGSYEYLKGLKGITLIKERKRGSYNARNSGISKSKGDILVFIDSDCIAEKNWLKNILKPFNDLGIDIVGGRIKAHNPKSIIQKYCDLYCHDQALSFSQERPYFATSNIAIRKHLFTNKKFDDRYSGSDVMFCRRFVKKQFYYQSSAVVKHIYSKSIIDFIRKQYTYGKWSDSERLTQLGVFWFLARFEIDYLFFRFIQDFSFYIGVVVGKLFKNNH